MGTLTDATYAATLEACIDEARVDAGLIQDVANVLKRAGHLRPGNEAAFGRDEWLKRRVEKVLEGGQWAILVHWDPPQDGEWGPFIQYAIEIGNPDRLKADGLAVLRVAVMKEHMPKEGPRTGFMVETFKNVVKSIQPRFAFLDLHHEKIKPRAGQDPRRCVWGAMYYSPDEARALGVERLRACAAAVKEEWPEGSFWIQADADPFSPASAAKARLAGEFGLQGPPEQSGTVPVAKVNVRPARKGEYAMPVGAAIVGRRGPGEAAMGTTGTGRVASKTVSILVDNERLEGVTLGETAFGATPDLVEIQLASLREAYEQANAKLRPEGQEARLFVVSLGVD